MIHRCIQCQGSDILRGVRVIDRMKHGSRDLSLEVHEKPDALIFKETHTVALAANVCVTCGFVMFSVPLEQAKMIKKYHKDMSIYSAGTDLQISPEAQGEAMCIGCRCVGPKNILYYDTTNDVYYHADCLPTEHLVSDK